MSNLDTTLRENEEELKLLMGAAALDFADLSEKEWEAILAYITKAYKLGRSEFHQLLNEKREAIEKLKEPFEGCELADHDKSYIAALDDVLSILKD